MTTLSKYGEQRVFEFTLYSPDGLEFQAGLVHASGDTQISSDGGAFINTSNAFVEVGGGKYTLTLTTAEMQAARITLRISDVTDPSAWLDKAIDIETYGDAAAQHAFDLDTSTVRLSAVTHTGATIPAVTAVTDSAPAPTNMATASNQTLTLGRLGSFTGSGINNVLGAFRALMDSTASLPSDIGDGNSYIPTTDSLQAIRDSVALQSDLTTLSNRLGAFSVTGNNTVLGFFRALMRSDATLPSDIGGTYSTGTDSLEAIRNTEPLGTTMRGTDQADLATEVASALTDALRTSTVTELGAVPAASASIADMIAFLYMYLRNETRSSSAGSVDIRNDAGTVIGSASVTDDGVLFTRTKYT